MMRMLITPRWLQTKQTTNTWARLSWRLVSPVKKSTSSSTSIRTCLSCTMNTVFGVGQTEALANTLTTWQWRTTSRTAWLSATSQITRMETIIQPKASTIMGSHWMQLTVLNSSAPSQLNFAGLMLSLATSSSRTAITGSSMSLWDKLVAHSVLHTTTLIQMWVPRTLFGLSWSRKVHQRRWLSTMYQLSSKFRTSLMLWPIILRLRVSSLSVSTTTLASWERLTPPQSRLNQTLCRTANGSLILMWALVFWTLRLALATSQPKPTLMCRTQHLINLKLRLISTAFYCLKINCTKFKTTWTSGATTFGSAVSLMMLSAMRQCGAMHSQVRRIRRTTTLMSTSDSSSRAQPTQTHISEFLCMLSCATVMTHRTLLAT